MDHQEEQQLELEALEAILMDDLQSFEGTRPAGWPTDAEIHLVRIRPSKDAATAASDTELEAELLFAHTPSYPEEAPLVKIRSAVGLSDRDIEKMQALLEEQVEENLGMAVVYALVTAAQEWLTEKVSADVEVEVDPEIAKKAAEEAEERRLAEMRRLGTPVTPETFAPWKVRFYAELAAARARSQKAKESEGRITGKQFFLQADSRRAAGEPDGDYVSEGELSDEDFDYSDDDDDGMLEGDVLGLVRQEA